MNRPYLLVARSLLMITVFAVLLGGVAMAQETAAPNQEGFEQMVDGLLSHTVNEVRVEDLGQKPDALLLDSREKGEFKVSHIEGARWVGYDDFSASRLKKIPKDQEIIVYCSVGYRSEKIAEQLRELGYTNVSNLYGGIFDWVNKEQPVVDKKDRPTDCVHPYDENWGQWVFKCKKEYN